MLLSAASGHRLSSKPKSNEMVQKKSDVTVPEEKDKESTTAQTEEDIDPNALFAFSQVVAAGGNVLKTCDEIDKDQEQSAKAEAEAKQQRLWQFALDLQKPKVVKSKE